MKYIILLALLLILVSCASQEQIKNVDSLKQGQYEVVSDPVNYFEDTNGFYAKPSVEGSYPGVILIHEWWGLNDNIKDMAELLASDGYIVLAVDLYEGKVAQNQDEARQLTSSLNQTRAVENMKAAVEYLREQGASKVGSLGWCFGGGQSLQLALNDGIDATIIYYGRLVDDEDQLSKITWPVLGIFGDKDTSILVDSVNAFDAALDKLNIENEIYIYPNVGHAFANPSGMNYAPEETKDAWEKTLAFLERHLK
jgi:carboxymethylenebutenolidase